MATAEFSKFAGIVCTALSQHQNIGVSASASVLPMNIYTVGNPLTGGSVGSFGITEGNITGKKN